MSIPTNKNQSLQSRFRTLLLVWVLPMTSWANELVDDDELVYEPVKQDRYQIEFLLFKQNAPQFEVIEHEGFSGPISVPESSQSLYPFGSNALSNHNAVLSPDTTHSLSDAKQRLASEGYTILSSGAWEQALDKNSRSLPLVLEQSKTFPDPFWTDAPMEDKDGQHITNEAFSGFLTIRRSRYIHAEIEVDYQFLRPFESIDWLTNLRAQSAHLFMSNFLIPKVDSESQTSQVSVKSVKFKDSRRIKNGEIHYLDHPLLGLIVTVKRTEQEEIL